MKKKLSILIPALLLALPSCGGGDAPAVSPADQALEAVKNLAYRENYGDNLSIKVADQAAFKAAIIATAKSDATNLKKSYALYNGVSYIEEGKTNSQSYYYDFDLYDEYAAIIRKVTVEEDKNLSTGVTASTREDRYGEHYHDETHNCEFEHDIYGGGHHLEKTDFKDRDPDWVTSTIQWDHNSIIDDCFYYANDKDCEYYKVGNKYIGYYCEDSLVDYETYQRRTVTQIIYEFDENYHLIYGSYYNDDSSNYDHYHNTPISSMKSDYYIHEIYTGSYGARQAKSVVSNKVEELYGKPYFDDYAYMVFENVDYNRLVKLITPQLIQIESYITFYEYSKDAVDVTPYIELSIFDNMNADKDHDVEVAGKFTIESPQYMAYAGNKLYYTMQNAEVDSAYFVMQYELVGGEPQYRGGSVRYATKAEMLEYFGS